jgi:large subunit ribosomal protein L15
MQFNQISRKNPNRKARRVGRGGKRGKTSGRGTKGQNARAGRKKRPEIRDRIKKLPKLRGYFFKSIVEKAYPVTLSLIEKKYKDGETVSPRTLVGKGAVAKKGNKYPRVKILMTGVITKKVKVTLCEISDSAKKAIEAAGGSVE